MRSLALAALLCWISSQSGWARLGENEAQLTARFGPGVATPSQDTDSFSKHKTFHKNGFVIEVWLINGTSVAEDYMVPTAPSSLTEDQIDSLLMVESGNHQWVEDPTSHPGTLPRTWAQLDGGKASWDGNKMRFRSKRFLDKLNAYQQAQVPSVKGF